MRCLEERKEKGSVCSKKIKKKKPETIWETGSVIICGEINPYGL